MKKNSILGSLLIAIASSILPANAAHIDGSLTSGTASVDLTAAGAQDWALWGFGAGGTSTSLAPDVRKIGGSAISDLTYLNPNSQPLRALGQFSINFGFSWTDGNTTATAAGAHGGLQVNTGNGPGLGVGEGFSLTVPADFFERVVTICVQEHEGAGQLTATLSDGSAAPYVDASLPTGINSPGIYTIHYSAASLGQTLTLEWKELSSVSTFDNPGIYAVAVSSVPEPGALALFGMGIFAAIWIVVRRRW